jgi:signal transduction histidine kinase
MPEHPRRHEAEGSIAVATVFLGFDRQGWITVIATVLLALITLFTSYDHVSVLGTTAIDLPQQAGIPCIAAAVAAALAEAQLASNDRQESAAIRAGAEDSADEERKRAARERERAARSDRVQARALRAGALVWLNPTPLNQRFLELVAAELTEIAQQ